MISIRFLVSRRDDAFVTFGNGHTTTNDRHDRVRDRVWSQSAFHPSITRNACMQRTADSRTAIPRRFRNSQGRSRAHAAAQTTRGRCVFLVAGQVGGGWRFCLADFSSQFLYASPSSLFPGLGFLVMLLIFRRPLSISCTALRRRLRSSSDSVWSSHSFPPPTFAVVTSSPGVYSVSFRRAWIIHLRSRR